MHRRILSTRQRHELRATLKTTKDVRQYRRVLALLELDQGRSLVAVAKTLGVSRASVHTWRRTFLHASDPAVLVDRPRKGRPRQRTASVRQTLKDCLPYSPEHYGYQSTEWTVPLLIKHLERVLGPHLSDETIRRELHELGYLWKRPRYRLAKDPARGKKNPRHPIPAAHAGSRCPDRLRG